MGLFRCRASMKAISHLTRFEFNWQLPWGSVWVFDKCDVNLLRPRQNGRHFADDTLKRIFTNENVRILIEISLNFVPESPINKIPALVQIMAWRRPGDKPLSEPLMVCIPTHICVTRPQWVNWCMLSRSLCALNLVFCFQIKYISVKTSIFVSNQALRVKRMLSYELVHNDITHNYSNNSLSCKACRAALKWTIITMSFNSSKITDWDIKSPQMRCKWFKNELHRVP